MRILLQNIQLGIGMTKGYYQYPFISWKYLLPNRQKNLTQISESIKGIKADVVLLTEVDAGSFRTGGLNQLEAISQASKYPYRQFFPTRLVWPFAQHGNGALSKLPILVHHHHPLPGKGEPRFLSHFRVQPHPGGQKVNIFLTHLSLNRSHRQSQLITISQLVKKTKGLLVLAGDFNIDDESELDVIPKLYRASRLNTFPAWKPASQLDQVLLSPELKLAKITTTTEKISDHLGLIIDLKLK